MGQAIFQVQSDLSLRIWGFEVEFEPDLERSERLGYLCTCDYQHSMEGKCSCIPSQNSIILENFPHGLWFLSSIESGILLQSDDG